jgi:hypothetical protein
MLSNRFLPVVLAASAMLLALVVPAQAQDVEALWEEETMPPVPAGAYATTQDNEDNLGTGTAVGDMGLATGANQ